MKKEKFGTSFKSRIGTDLVNDFVDGVRHIVAAVPAADDVAVRSVRDNEEDEHVEAAKVTLAQRCHEHGQLLMSQVSPRFLDNKSKLRKCAPYIFLVLGLVVNFSYCF